MKYYTNLKLKNQEDLQGTATIITYKDIQGKLPRNYNPIIR